VTQEPTDNGQAGQPSAQSTPSAPSVLTVRINRDQVIERQGRQFVLYAGLLDAAHRVGLQGISTDLLQAPSKENGETCIVHAVARFAWGAFDGIGDANPGNTGRMIVPHLIRMAETRAKARALRDGLNVGMAAVEELTSLDEAAPEPRDARDQRQDRQDRPAAPRPVQAQAAVPQQQRRVDTAVSPAQSPPPQREPDYGQDERAKYLRLAATAQRLGVPEVVVLPDGASEQEIVALRNQLVGRVNEAIKQQREAGQAGPR